MASTQLVYLGKIIREWGIKGQVRFVSFNPDSTLYPKLKKIYLECPAGCRELKLEIAKRHGRFWLLKLEGYENPESARELRGIQIGIPRSDLPEPSNNEVYLADLEGREVRNAEGDAIGVIERFLKVGDTEVMVIKREAGKEAMVPFHSEFVESTSPEGIVVLKKQAADLL